VASGYALGKGRASRGKGHALSAWKLLFVLPARSRARRERGLEAKACLERIVAID
jgi:hypothetical protein